MQMSCYLYINRSWEADQILMNKVLDYFKDIRHKCQVCKNKLMHLHVIYHYVWCSTAVM
jgi:hypothetical protein